MKFVLGEQKINIKKSFKGIQESNYLTSHVTGTKAAK